MTISIPQNKQISRLSADALVEKLECKKMSLEEQYKLAGQDEKRNDEFREWEDAMIGDGLYTSIIE